MQHTLAPNPLIARIAEGECDALTALYARDGAWVYALACRFVSEEDVAADVVEEVFDVLWDEITENGLPDIGTRPWLIWLTRARARELILSGGARPSDLDWTLPSDGTPFLRAFANLPDDEANLLLRAWKYGGIDPDLSRPELRLVLKSALAGLVDVLPPDLRADPMGSAGVKVALDLLRLLSPEEREGIHERLPVSPPLRAVRRAWAEALAELATPLLGLETPLPAPPEGLEERVIAATRGHGPVRAFIEQLELIPLVLGSAVAVLIAFGVMQLAEMKGGSTAMVQTASLRSEPLAPVMFDVAYAPIDRRLLIRPSEQAMGTETIWLHVGAAEPRQLGMVAVLDDTVLTLPVDLPADLTGARLIIRSASGEILAEGRLRAY